MEILPAAGLPRTWSLPVVPRPCPISLSLSPPPPPSLSPSCKHKYNTCYFSTILPSPKHAVLLSHGVSSWGTSCSTGSKFQDKMKIFGGCSWFPAVWHAAGKMRFKHALCSDVPSHQHGAVSLKLGDLMTALGILWVFLAWVLCWFPVWATGRLSSHLSHRRSGRGLMDANDKHWSPLMLLIQMSHYALIMKSENKPFLTTRTKSWHHDHG